MSLRCVIVDDDKYSLATLKGYIRKIKGAILVKEFLHPLDALKKIRKEDEIDVIFMDIHMPGMNGIELADLLKDKTIHTIFTTAHKDYLLDAFDLHARQYLLKPITFAKFAFEVGLLIDMKYDQQADQDPKHEIMFVKRDHKSTYSAVNVNEIIYIEALRNYIKVYTSDEMFTQYMSLNEALEFFGEDKMIRVNRSIVVAINQIKSIEGNLVILKTGKQFSLGTTYRDDFFDYVKKNSVPKDDTC